VGGIYLSQINSQVIEITVRVNPMNPNINEPAIPSRLMHEIVGHVSSIMSVAQYALISKEMSPEIQTDMKRIVEMARNLSNNVQDLADILEEEK